jgi:hypothetical protein
MRRYWCRRCGIVRDVEEALAEGEINPMEFKLTATAEAPPSLSGRSAA